MLSLQHPPMNMLPLALLPPWMLEESVYVFDSPYSTCVIPYLSDSVTVDLLHVCSTVCLDECMSLAMVSQSPKLPTALILCHWLGVLREVWYLLSCWLCHTQYAQMVYNHCRTLLHLGLHMFFACRQRPSIIARFVSMHMYHNLLLRHNYVVCLAGLFVCSTGLFCMTSKIPWALVHLLSKTGEQKIQLYHLRHHWMSLLLPEWLSYSVSSSNVALILYFPISLRAVGLALMDITSVMVNQQVL